MRLPNGYGSVFKKSGNRRNPWVARKTIGWKDNGQPNYVYIGFFPTKKAAMQALAEYNADPYSLESKTTTFADMYALWSSDHFKRIKQNTISTYEKSYRICEPIHHLTLDEIRLQTLQDMVDQSGKNEPMLKHVRNLLTQVFDYAVKNEILKPEKREIIRYLRVDTGNPNRIERKIFSDGDVRQILSGNTAAEMIISVLLMTGLRVGELFDLKKEDVHLSEHWFHVAESKTKAGIRDVPIADILIPCFESFMSNDSEYAFSYQNGKKISYSGFCSTLFKPYTDILGVHHTPHDTRHTFVSKLVETGTDERIIRAIVGHTGRGVTEQVYTHIGMDQKLSAVNNLALAWH